MRIGFIGLGVMGAPMAGNLLRGGVELVVWNRTIDRCLPLAERGAQIAASPGDVFAAAPVVVLMLANAAATDEVLMRDRAGFESMVRDHTVVSMGTTSPEYSRRLESDIRAAGGRYVEAPVSGSRSPAEAGTLIGMLAGDPEAIADVTPLVRIMCAETFVCGAVPQALLMKLSVNLFLITMVAGLTEAVHFAESHGVDVGRMAQIIDSGPMSSSVSHAKLEKLVARDFSVQASIESVAMNSRLIAEAAHSRGVSTPLLDVANALFADALARGDGGLDMAAVLRVVKAEE